MQIEVSLSHKLTPFVQIINVFLVNIVSKLNVWLNLCLHESDTVTRSPFVMDLLLWTHLKLSHGQLRSWSPTRVLNWDQEDSESKRETKYQTLLNCHEQNQKKSSEQIQNALSIMWEEIMMPWQKVLLIWVNTQRKCWGRQIKMGHKRGCSIVLQPSHLNVTAVWNLWYQHLLHFSKALNGKTPFRIFSANCNEM